MILHMQEKQHEPPAEGENRVLGGRRGGRSVRQAAGLHDSPRFRVQPARQQHHPARFRDILPAPGEVLRVLGKEKQRGGGVSQGCAF